MNKIKRIKELEKGYSSPYEKLYNPNIFIKSNIFIGSGEIFAEHLTEVNKIKKQIKENIEQTIAKTVNKQNINKLVKRLTPPRK